MDVTVQNVQNDVPEFLNDLIPYRCPKCGHQRRFATLRELRMHLQNDHAFQMGYIKPHTRATVFSKDSNIKHNITQRENSKDMPIGPFSGGPDTANAELIDYRESSPLLRSFKDEKNMLEMEVQKAKQNEMRNKALSMKNLSKDAFHAEYPTSLRDLEVEHNRKGKQSVTVPALGSTEEYRNHTKPTAQYPEVKSTLDRLNAEVMRSRLDQWVTNDALYKSQDILLSMEAAADANVREQQGIVEQLIQDIKNKGDRIEEREREQREMLDERQRLYNKTENLMKDADTYNQSLKHELDQRSSALDNLAADMKRLQTMSEKELKRKENDLQCAQEKMRHLEWERDKLIEETETILKRADTDNVDLRNTVKRKEEELNVVNKELYKLRQNQQNMLEKTVDIQKRAEESKRLMKTVIDAKNNQLESAERQLQEMKALQGQLIEESKILTEQADDNTHSMKRLLQIKEEHVIKLTTELEKLREEKIRLEESTSSLEEKAEQSITMIDSLKDVVRNKEKDLKNTQSELADLKEFLQSAAARERGARKKLEKFIDDLIMRAEKAEAELRALRSRSTNTSASTAGTDETREGQKQALDDLKNELKERSLSKTVPEESSVGKLQSRQQEQSSPMHLSPKKPPRTKLRSPNPDSMVPDTVSDTKKFEKNNAILQYDRKLPRQVVHTKAEVHNEGTSPSHEESSVQENKQNKIRLGGRAATHSQAPKSSLAGTHVYPYRQEGIDNEEDSTTLNTDSLINYLNDGLLKGSEDRITKARSGSKTFAVKSPRNNADSNQVLPPQNKNSHVAFNQSYGPTASISNEHIYYENRGNSYLESPRSKPLSSQGFDTKNMYMEDLEQYRLYSVNDMNHGIRNFSPEDQRYLKHQYQHSVPFSHSSVGYNRNDLYGVNSYRRLYEKRTDPAIDDRRFANKRRKEKLLYLNTKPRQEKVYDGKNAPFKNENKPGRQGVSKSKRSYSPQRNKKRTKGSSKIRKLRQFDSRYPEIYKSMYDLHSGPRQRSKEKPKTKSRRSRSLSPGISEHKDRSNRSHKYMIDRLELSDEANNTDADQMSEEIVDEGSQRYALLEESSDENEHGFVELMDDNGILWASDDRQVNHSDYNHDEDADTLPDISDSELDRVSPSGSEAIPTKKTYQASAMITPLKSTQVDLGSRMSSSLKYKSKKFSNTDNSKSSSRSLSSRNNKEHRTEKPHKKSQGLRENMVYVKRDLDEKPERKRVVQVSRTNEEQLLKKEAVFKPINAACSSKHSLSEKDLTSGGKEVHEYITKSPSVHVTSLSTESRTKLPERYSSSASNSRRRSNETLEEKLARISEKYKLQRVVIGSSKDNSNGISKSGNTIDSKVKVIDEKYKEKRKAITENKGISGIEEQKGVSYKIRSTDKSISNLDIGKTWRDQRVPDRTSLSRNYNVQSHLSSPKTNWASEKSVNEGMGFFVGPDGSGVINHFVPPPHANAPSLTPGPHHSHGTAESQNTFYNQTGLRFPPNYAVNPLHNTVPLAEHLTNSYNPPYNNVPANPTFPYLFPYFHPGLHPGLQSSMVSQGATHAPDQSSRHTTTESVATIRLTSPTNTKNSIEVDKKDTVVRSESYITEKEIKNDNGSNETSKRIPKKLIEITPGNKRTSSMAAEIEQNDSPLAMKESDVETEGVSRMQRIDMSLSFRSEDINDKLNAVQKNADERVSIPPRKEYSSTDSLNEGSSTFFQNQHVKNAPNKTNGFGPNQNNVEEQLQTEENDSSSAFQGTSMFAVPIEDDNSGVCGSNTQSVIDLQGSGADTDLDTDTESVRRDFFEKARKVRGLVEHIDDDDVDSVSQRSYRNIMSSASSQASIDFLENIPISRREETKRRRQALSSIFNFLDTASLCKVAEVCREWKIVSRSPKLWKRIELKNEKVSSKFLFFLARRSSQLKVLNIEDVRPRNRRQDETVEDYQSSLRLSLDGAIEQILKRSEASLHTISIINCGTMLSSKCLWAASCYSRMLKHVTYITDFDPVSSEVMWALGSGCRDLQTLVVNPVQPCQNADKFNTRCAQLIGKCFPVLEKLSVGGRAIDISTLVYIAKQCQHLRHVELHHMSMVTKDVAEQTCEHGFGKIRVIKLMSTPIEPKGITVLSEHCKYLETFHLRLSVNDYFNGADQQEDLKVFESVTREYEDLKKDPRLRRILKLKISKF